MSLRIVHGHATAEEVAALVAVLASRGRAVEVPVVRAEWSRPRPRAALPAPGPGAWQAATRR